LSHESRWADGDTGEMLLVVGILSFKRELFVFSLVVVYHDAADHKPRISQLWDNAVSRELRFAVPFHANAGRERSASWGYNFYLQPASS
jgi:hypothetical protein